MSASAPIRIFRKVAVSAGVAITFTLGHYWLIPADTYPTDKIIEQMLGTEPQNFHFMFGIVNFLFFLFVTMYVWNITANFFSMFMGAQTFKTKTEDKAIGMQKPLFPSKKFMADGTDNHDPQVHFIDTARRCAMVKFKYDATIFLWTIGHDEFQPPSDIFRPCTVSLTKIGPPGCTVKFRYHKTVLNSQGSGSFTVAYPPLSSEIIYVEDKKDPFDASVEECGKKLKVKTLGRAKFRLEEITEDSMTYTRTLDEQVVSKTIHILSKDDFKRDVNLVVGELHSEDGTVVEHPKWLILPERGLMQGTLITGVPGTGKTAGTLYPMLHQMLSHPGRLGGLILDVKGDFGEQVYEYLRLFGREDDLQLIEPGKYYTYNPLYQDAPAEALASRLTEAIVNLMGGMGANEGFWIQTAEETGRNIIRLMNLIYGYCTLADINELATNDDSLDDEFKKLLKVQEERRISSDEIHGVHTWVRKWKNMEDKIKSGVISEVTRMGSVFTDTLEYRRTFCPEKEAITFSGFEDVINKGKIVVLNMPVSKYGNAASTVAVLLKLDWFDTVTRRITTENMKRIVDKYYQLVLCRRYLAHQDALDEMDNTYAAILTRGARDSDPRLKRLRELRAAIQTDEDFLPAKLKALDELLKNLDPLKDSADYYRVRDMFNFCQEVMEMTEDPRNHLFIDRASPSLMERRGELIEKLSNPLVQQEEKLKVQTEIQVIERQMVELIQDYLLVASASAGKSGILNIDRKVFFVCDEYQAFVSGGGVGSGKGDNMFYDRARQAKCINILATQAYNSLQAKLKPEAMENILTNLQTKFWLKTEDPKTADAAAKACGKADFIDASRSIGENSEGMSYVQNQFVGGKGVSDSISLSRKEEEIFRYSEFMALDEFVCIFKGSDGSSTIGPYKLYLPRFWEWLDGRYRTWFDYKKEIDEKKRREVAAALQDAV